MMKELFSKRAKKIITAVSLSCFLCSPVSYVFSMNQASAAALNSSVAYEQQFNTVGFDKDDHWNRGRSDEDKDWKNPPPPRDDKDKNDKRPPRHDNDNDWKNPPQPPRHDNDNDKDWKNPPPPPRHDNDDDDWDPPPPPRHDRDDDSDKDYDKGDITAAVLIGGVIGAIIAKNT